MAGRINQQPPTIPFWPWPGNVRESLVDRAQLERKRRGKKLGDPRNPPLASAALLDFMGPGHSSEELRLPAPPLPRQGDAASAPDTDAPAVAELMEKGSASSSDTLQRCMQRLAVPADRMARLQALLSRESGMLTAISRLSSAVQEIQHRMTDEQKTRGY